MKKLLFLSCLIIVSHLQMEKASGGVLQSIVNRTNLVHFKIATQEFEQNKDQIRFDLNKNNIKEYYNSGAYEKEVEALCKEAECYFDKLGVTEKYLIVFDVDDTAVYAFTDWKREILDINPSETTIILPVLNLYKFLIKKGFKIFFITGRPFEKHEETKQELKKAGYVNFVDLACMPSELHVGNTRENVAKWKCGFRKELSERYSIVGSVADRDVDFAGGYCGHVVKLPNYIY